LIAIRDPDPPDIDAADHLAIDYENIVEREIAMRDDGIGRHRQQLTHCLPHLFRRPAFTLIVEIIFLNQPRVDLSRALARR
jgi:hypothetical protein